MTEFARACQDTREHTALLPGTAPTGCLSGMAEKEKRLAITKAHSIFTKDVTSHCTVAGTRMMRCPLLPKNRTLVAWGHTLSAFYRIGKAYIFNPAF